TGIAVVLVLDHPAVGAAESIGDHVVAGGSEFLHAAATTDGREGAVPARDRRRLVPVAEVTHGRGRVPRGPANRRRADAWSGTRTPGARARRRARRRGHQARRSSRPRDRRRAARTRRVVASARTSP